MIISNPRGILMILLLNNWEQKDKKNFFFWSSNRMNRDWSAIKAQVGLNLWAHFTVSFLSGGPHFISPTEHDLELTPQNLKVALICFSQF